MLKILSAAAVIATAGAQTWSYDRDDEVNGPDHWEDSYPDCGRMKQSPINIKTADGQRKKNRALPNIVWHGGTPEETHTVTNNGYAIQTTATYFKDIILTGGIMDKNYTLAKVQVHWDNSEHKINGRYDDGEIHFHFEDKVNGADANEGRTIIGVMIAKGDRNKDMQPFFDSVASVTQPGTSVEATFTLDDWLPRSFDDDYYTYSGSLTYPPCTQNVQWIIPRRKITCSKSQLATLKTLLNDEGDVNKRAYRPEQKLFARKVFKSFKKGSGGSSASMLGNMFG